jgi:hypothetical protein
MYHGKQIGWRNLLQYIKSRVRVCTCRKQLLISAMESMESSGRDATLAEVLDHWANGDADLLNTISLLVPKEAMEERLDFAFRDGTSTGALEGFIQGKDTSILDRCYYRSFNASCCEWSTKGFKRPRLRWKFEDYAQLPSPSEFAKNWSETQTRDSKQLIYCARPHQASWINVRIMHRGFNEVVQAFMAGIPQPEDYNLAIRLRVLLADPFESESNRRDDVHSILNQYLFLPLGFSVDASLVPGKDFTSDGSSPEHGINLVVENEKGMGEGDPYMKNIAFFVHFTARASFRNEIVKHCCPWLLLEVVGQKLGISGAAWACDKPCAQPLTPNVPFLLVAADAETILLQA